MYFKLMNGREEYLAGMRELLEERHHQVVSEDAGEKVNPVLNGGLETPVEIWMELVSGEQAGSEDMEAAASMDAAAFREVVTEFGCQEADGLRKGKAVLKAGGKTFLFRALMTLVRELEKQEAMHAGMAAESFCRRETVYLDKNGTMLDCSRNSVLSVESIKKYIRMQAALGMNTMMLYTEDTYEVPEYPYFGAFRGRYTREELKECDDYADRFGIEMVPCIQALAHLKTALRWDVMQGTRDTEDILLVGEEKVYDFVKACIRSASEPFRSRRVHLGMDEAWSLGLGNYLLKNGYHTKAEIMTEHLDRVAGICRDLGLEPMIWSDMYLRMNSPASEYYDVPLDTDLSGAVKPPREIGLVYWDYYHTDENFYKAYLHMHRQLSEKTVFAGGGWVWNGLAPNFGVAFSTTEAAMRACKAEGIREAVCTMWQDDGAETPMAAGLPSIVLFAEHGFSEQPDREQLKEQFEFLTGSSYDAYMALGEFDAVPGSEMYDNPSKYLFYQDILLGLFDGQVREADAFMKAGSSAKTAAASGDYFAAAGGHNLDTYYDLLREKLQDLAGSETAVEDGVLELYIHLADVLSMKAGMGNRLCAAYKEEDRETIQKIAEEEIPSCIEKVKEYKRCREAVWDKESKIYGFEVLDIRIGGLLARMESAQKRLLAYACGKLERLPELEEERLAYRPVKAGDEHTLCSCNTWRMIVSASPV